MRVFGLARLTPRERLVIGLLRGVDPVALTDELKTRFERLHIAACGLGYRAGPCEGRYASRHELCLLGCIAALQRKNPDALLEIGDAIRAPARACADQLVADGIFLSHAAISRLSSLPDACRQLCISSALPVQSSSQAARSSPALPGSGHHAVLGIIHAQGTMSSRDLVACGISRQVVSRMFKRGLLVRVRTGLYRVAPGAM